MEIKKIGKKVALVIIAFTVTITVTVTVTISFSSKNLPNDEQVVQNQPDMKPPEFVHNPPFQPDMKQPEFAHNPPFQPDMKQPEFTHDSPFNRPELKIPLNGGKREPIRIVNSDTEDQWIEKGWYITHVPEWITLDNISEMEIY